MRINLERVMELFIAFFIVVTGVNIAPMVADNSNYFFTLIYSLSIVFSSVYFLWRAISLRFVNQEDSE